MQHSTERFSDRVSNYVKYRPSYPVELVQDLATDLELHRSTVIADIGSGTGKLSALFVQSGFSVIGVEPNAEMRQAAESVFAGQPLFSSISATAENTGLDDGSVDLIIAGQAFHWFEQAPAKIEFNRILKPDGHIALIWNQRRIEQPFQRDYDRMLSQYCEEYDLSNHRNISDDDIQQFYSPGTMRMLRYKYSQQFDLHSFLGRMESSSYTPKRGTAAFEKLNQVARSLFAQYAKNSLLDFEYDTCVYVRVSQ